MPTPQRKAPMDEEPDLPTSDTDENWVVLQRPSGSRERFRGAILADANNYNPNTVAWHELQLYRKDDAGFVLCIQMRQKAIDVEDTMHIFNAEDMNRVMDILESYGENLQPDDLLPEEQEDQDAPMQAALGTATLLQNLELVRRHYSALSGDFMFAIHGLG